MTRRRTEMLVILALISSIAASCVGSPRCIQGLRSDATGTCQNIDECSERGSALCTGAHALCLDLDPLAAGNATHELYRCGCQPGFRDSGGTCVDDDECTLPATCGVSSGAGTCQNVANGGGYNCTCNAGYRLTDSVTDPGLPKTCADVRECDTPTTCGAGVGAGACTNLAGGYSCQCNSGYAQPSGLNPPACADVNECATNNGGCNAPNAVCSNSPGAYSCSCAPGYSGDGITACTDVNECVANTDDCDPLAICTNVVGGFTCACSPGYSGSGKSCADSNECMVGNPCNEDNGAAVCTNTTGSYTCACNTGFVPMAPGGAQAACVDVDECATNNGGCAVGATCVNSPGGFSCACPGAQVACNGTCVDLQTNSNHCGACNFPAVNGRTCVSGRPSPAWRVFPASGAPVAGPDRVAASSGLHANVFDSTGLYQYDPVTDAWTHPSTTYPFSTPSSGCSATHLDVLGIPDRQAVFLWDGASAYVFRDDATGGTFEGPFGAAQGAPSARVWPQMAYDGRYVYVAFGADGYSCAGGFSSSRADGKVFDLVTAQWVGAIPQQTLVPTGGNPADPAFGIANGMVMAFGGHVNGPGTAHITTTVMRLDISNSTSPIWASNWSSALPYDRWDNAVLLSMGNRSILFGDINSDRVGAWLLDPQSSSIQSATAPPSSAGQRYDSVAAYTGRAVIYWGGRTLVPSLTDFSTGSIGTFTGNVATWAALPALPNGVSGRALFPEENGHPRGGGGWDAQSAWTGRELMIFGSYRATSFISEGLRYQPPVGCVCPRVGGAMPWIHDVCTNVTGIAVGSCVPQ